MSNKSTSPSVGGTLAGGIQDVAALLPLIGTEQCEKHVGSALSGGYLYAAAAPLSIFGSLGIVKAGIAILISSISISMPNILISSSTFKPSIKYSRQRKWLGGRILKDAGFELTGTVAPLIGMDKHRFKAETRLIEMLEEKHIDDPEKISIEWRSRQWNVMLVVSTILSAALSLMPYMALLHGLPSWRPSSIHLFPALRIVGSCIATVACQFIVQSRVISIMKNRILFMTIDRHLNAKYKQGVDALLEDSKLQWDTTLPSEQCIWSLEQYISDGENSEGSDMANHMSERTSGDSDHMSIQMAALLPGSKTVSDQASSALPSASSTETASFTLNDFHRLQSEYFPTPTRDTTFIVFSWIMLGLSLPATVAGYIGCFTLVSASPSLGNGPLVWVGIEAALSILRIFIWASNPSFDEETEIALGLKLSKRQPMFTPDAYDPDLTNLRFQEGKVINLVPEREFLEGITPFLGPLNQFPRTNNITLYFTLTSNFRTDGMADIARKDGFSMKRETYGQLFITVYDFNMQVGVTFAASKASFHYFDVMVKYNTTFRNFQATTQSKPRDAHTWRIEDTNLFNSLQKYYQYVIGAFNWRNTDGYIPAPIGKSNLHWKWDLSAKSDKDGFQNDKFPSLTVEIQLYLERGYEHYLKTQLIVNWSRWIFMDMSKLRSHTRLDCHEALRDGTSEKAKWELTELDAQLVWGWASRELVLLMLSLELEDILRAKMELCASEVGRSQKDSQLVKWMNAEFESGWQKRIEDERAGARERMEREMKSASEQANRDGRPWQEDPACFAPQWMKAIDFIDKQWSTVTDNRHVLLRNAEAELRRLIGLEDEDRIRYRNDHRHRHGLVEQLQTRVSHEHWRPQHQFEEPAYTVIIMHNSTLMRIKCGMHVPSN